MMGMFNGDTATMLQQGPGLLEKADRVLDLILEALDTRIEQIAVTDQSTDPGLQKDFPTPGSQRWILHRTPDGREFEGTEKLEEMLPANGNRLGGWIRNNGEKQVKIYLCTPGGFTQGTAFITLDPKERWDFKLGNLLWSGSLSALAIGGTSKLTVVEV